MKTTETIYFTKTESKFSHSSNREPTELSCQGEQKNLLFRKENDISFKLHHLQSAKSEIEEGCLIPLLKLLLS